MDTEEHVYADDPAVGPPDVRTDLKGVCYYFVGNGHVQAAVQVDSSGAGTALGLLIMDPEQLGPKRAALSMDAEHGLTATAIRLRGAAGTFQARPEKIEQSWEQLDGLPVPQIGWEEGKGWWEAKNLAAESLSVEEVFFCPDRFTPRLIRELRFRIGSTFGELSVCTGPKESELVRLLPPSQDERVVLHLEYLLTGPAGAKALEVRWCDEPPDTTEATEFWNGLNQVWFPDDLLHHLYAVSRNQLPATPAHSGRLDASIWQYGREWVRDQSAVIHGRLLLGDFEGARRAIERLITEFTGEEGDTVDSGCHREAAETELDQNGELLLLVRTYVEWTGDLALAREHWPRLRAVAEFPLREVFRHGDSGLLVNRREYWERHAAHGITEGIELAHQLFVALGLDAAADLAKALEHGTDAKRWRGEASRLRRAMLVDAPFALIEETRLIKRRDVTGEWQQEIEPIPDAGLPRDTPLFAAGAHRLDPDTSTLYPIIHELVDPESELAWRTLESMDLLWNQAWEDGGYARYNVTSEAGAPAPWPITSLFVAQAALELGDEPRVWGVVDWICHSPGCLAGAWLEFFGEWSTPPFPQVGVIPWTWAEIQRLLVHHLLGIRPRLDGWWLRPRWLSDLERPIEARVRVRDHHVRLVVRIAKGREKPRFVVNGVSHPHDEAGLRLPLPTEDLEIEAILPEPDEE